MIALLAILLLPPAIFKARSKDLNLIIISIDTLRPDHMGVYGYDKNTTPNIDNFSKKSTVFTNVTTVVPMTHPSFFALMTGQDIFKTRITSNQNLDISDNIKTLATRLKEEGYKTSAFVSAESSLKQGFDRFKTYNFKYYFNQDGSDRFGQGSREGYEEFVNKAAESLSGKNGKFFTWIHLVDPHAPYFPPDDLKCKFNTSYCTQVYGKSLEEIDSLRAQYQQCQNKTVPKENIGLMQTLYDGDVAAADRLVGNIINKIKKENLFKNSVVLIYGDHGEGFDHNYYFNHQSVLYNSAVKIPLIIYHPFSRFHGYSNLLLQNTDILPTIMDLLNIPYEDTVSGKSFSSVFSPIPGSGLFKNPRQYSFSSDSMLKKFSVTDGKYKYILSLPGSCIESNQTEELYNLKNDRDETKNIIKKDPDAANNLKSQLLMYLSQYNLPLVIKPIISEEELLNSRSGALQD